MAKSSIDAFKQARKRLHSGALDVASYGRMEKELMDKSAEVRAHAKRYHANEHLDMEAYAKKRNEGWDGR